MINLEESRQRWEEKQTATESKMTSYREPWQKEKNTFLMNKTVSQMLQAALGRSEASLLVLLKQKLVTGNI